MRRANYIFALGMLVCILAFTFALAGCSDGNSSGGKGTLVVINQSTTDSEIITEVRTTNNDTKTTKEESVGTGIPKLEQRSFQLDEGQYTVRIETNYDDGDTIEFFLRSGSTVTIKWNGYRLSR